MTEAATSNADSVNQERLVSALLTSLHYGNPRKQESGIISQLREDFGIPADVDLQQYLIHSVDFTDLFGALLKLVEPFAKMLNDIYSFLSQQATTARTLSHLIVGENASNNLTFALESFPRIYMPVIQQIEGYLRDYDLNKIMNSNISPLWLTEALLGCGHCSDSNYCKTAKCDECGPELRARFADAFARFDEMIALIPEKQRCESPCEYLCAYFKEAKKSFAMGLHRADECDGYSKWMSLLDDIQYRFDLISGKQRGVYEVSVLLAFFELPFWNERNRLYEVWSLVHFLQLLRGVSFDLNVKDGQWHLMYGDATEPVAWARGKTFTIEVWYQHKLKLGLALFADEPIEPEMLFVLTKLGCEAERLVLIECKDRKDYDVREIKKLAAFYRAQAATVLNIFCNYLDYSPQTRFQVFSNELPVVICDQFRPATPTVADVDREFVKLMNEKLGVFLQAVLIDTSGSMMSKDIQGLYRELDKVLSQLPGSRHVCGLFSDSVTFYEPAKFMEILCGGVEIGGGTEFSRALSKTSDEVLANYPDTTVVNFYVVTDLGFNPEDWRWLHKIDQATSYNVTLVTRQGWSSNSALDEAKGLLRTKLLIL